MITQLPYVIDDIGAAIDGELDAISIIISIVIGPILSSFLLYGVIFRNLISLLLCIVVYVTRTVWYCIELIYLIIGRTSDRACSTISCELHEEFTDDELTVLILLVCVYIVVYIVQIVIIVRYSCQLFDEETCEECRRINENERGNDPYVTQTPEFLLTFYRKCVQFMDWLLQSDEKEKDEDNKTKTPNEKQQRKGIWK